MLTSQITFISEKETAEFFREGLLQAASSARMMSTAQKSELWADIASLLDELRQRGCVVANQRALSRQQVLDMLDIREKSVGDNVKR